MHRFLPVLIAVALLATAAPAASAASPTVTVTGEGTVSQQPDRATIDVALISSNDDAQAATSKNNATYAAVVGRLRSMGIAETMIRTTAFDVTFVPKPDPGAQFKPPRTGYVVTRRLGIDVDNLSVVGRAVDAAVGAGATEIAGVTFGLRDPRAAYAKALSEAMRDAALQAGALAGAAHLRLGAVQMITTARTLASPVPLMRAAAATVPTEIQPSAVEVRAIVDVTYGLEP